MNGAKRIGALLLTCVLLIGMLPAFALAEELVGSLSTHGAFVAELDGTVYAALTTGSDFGLYAIPANGGTIEQLDVASELGELVSANGNVYYLRIKDDGVQQIMRVDNTGVVSVLSDFQDGAVADHLSWYNDVLYCVAMGSLFIIDPYSGESERIGEELVDDYVIVNDVIFYISGSDQMTYDAGQDTQLKQTAGTLWSMSIFGTNPEKLVDKGVTDLRAIGSNLFFHNLEDSYQTISEKTGETWLEGKLYRYNIETAQMASMNLVYDWDFYPTPYGVLVFTKQDISLYPITGGEKTPLMTPHEYSYVTALGDYAFVYEYGVSKLSRLPLDGTEAVVLADDSDVLPTIEAAGLTDDTVPVDSIIEGETEGDSGEDIEDITYNETDESTSSGSSSTYIFPNSSKKKLTRKQVLAISKSNWGYARNEIYARHGYSFTKSKYKSYFSKKSWYKPGGFSSGSLSSIEWYNMELIRDLEEEYGLLEGTGTASSSGSGTDNTYVLKEASSKKLTKSYLRKKLGSKSKYALARNEILARHGYVFKTEKYKKYFAKQKWYKAGGYSSSKLSKTEWYNIEQLKDLENE